MNHPLPSPLRPSPTRPTRRGSLVSVRGFSLFEVMVALLIGTVTMGGLFSLTHSTSDASRDLDDNLRTLQANVDVFAALRKDLVRCRVREVASDGTGLVYNLPVPGGAGGGFVDDAGEVVWGVSDSDGVHLDGTVSLAFVFEKTVRESEEGADLNGDGDRADSFDVGRLARTSSTGERLGIPRMDVYVPSGDRGGDLDGDGTPDPLFSLDPANRQVVVRMGLLRRKGQLRIFVLRSAVDRIELKVGS